MGNESERRRQENDEAPPGAEGAERAVRVPPPRTDPPGASGAGPAARASDWWRADVDGGFAGVAVPGFYGGVEIPELLKPPPPEEEAEENEAASDDEAVEDEEPPRRSLRGLLGSPLLLAAAVLLLTGAAGGWLLPLAAGWLLAYASRERRAAVLTLPGLAVAAAAVWLWGRVEGRWGERVAAGSEAMGTALSETWPWTLRGAAIASGLYLLWRSRRG